MADNGIRAITPILLTLSTTSQDLVTVPANKERTYTLIRISNKGSDSVTTVFSLRYSGVTKVIGYQVTDPNTSYNIVGPDILGPLPAGSVITGITTTGTNNTVDVIITGTERDI